MIARGASTHLIGKHSRATTKFAFLDIVFRLEAKIIKLKAGHGSFLCCQCARAFPVNIIVLLAPPLKAILLPRSHLALRSACHPARFEVQRKAAAGELEARARALKSHQASYQP